MANPAWTDPGDWEDRVPAPVAEDISRGFDFPLRVVQLARHLAEHDGLRKNAPEEELKPWLRHAKLSIEFLTKHRSDCAVHNAPAAAPGPCDCEGYIEGAEGTELRAECERLRFGLRYWRDQYIGATVDKALAAGSRGAETGNTDSVRSKPERPEGQRPDTVTPSSQDTDR